MCSNRDWFDKLEESDCGEVQMGNHSTCKVRGIGTVKIRMHDQIVRTLGSVRYIPTLRKNLISLGILDKNGYTFTSTAGKLVITKGSHVVIKGEKLSNNLYRLLGDTVVGGASVSTEVNSDIQLWHFRLGHISERGLQELHKRQLLPGVEGCKLEFCQHCIIGKQTRVSFKSADKGKRADVILKYIHSDVWGPAPTKSKRWSSLLCYFS